MTIRRVSDRSPSRSVRPRHNGAYDYHDPAPIRISAPDGSYATLTFGKPTLLAAIDRLAEFDQGVERDKISMREIESTDEFFLGDFVGFSRAFSDAAVPKSVAFLTLSLRISRSSDIQPLIHYLVGTAERIARVLERKFLCVEVRDQSELLELVPAGFTTLVYPSGSLNPKARPTRYAEDDTLGEPYVDPDPYFPPHVIIIGKAIDPVLL